ncbi:unnamed protein product [Brachionus calyciflorus]|uniref:Rnh202 triple barrel domain-containing protein n=1 Tax=Brachionus calyciflorus TaxID=104777 RepID=A0A813NE07_9BILA|nr:unnamed protein product [Brachionus calyciflorus]
MKKILILNQTKIVDSADLKTIGILNLKHPKEGEKVPFLIHETCDDLIIYELINYTQETSCLFIDNYIQTDSLIYFLTKFNLCYFIIDFLTNCDQFEFESVDEFKSKLFKYLTDSKEEFSSLSKLKLPDLKLFFDVTEDESKFEIIFNGSKCNEWLKTKIDKLCNLIETSNNGVEIKKKLNDDPKDKNDKIKQEAFDLISQYLNKNISTKLRKELSLSSPLTELSSENKRAKQNVVTLD